MVTAWPKVKGPVTPSMLKLCTVTSPSTELVPVKTLPVVALLSSATEMTSSASVKLSFSGVISIVSVAVLPVLVV